MAFTQFYIQPTNGSDLNAGSTTAAVLVSYAGGTFVRATGVFTVATGDPVADGVVAGDWVSIYTTAGATTTKCVAKCLSRTTTTITVDVATDFYGAAANVSETGAAATAKVGGPHASPTPWNSTGFGGTNVPASTCINIKRATYTRPSANDTYSINGLTTAPLWFRGYNTTPGDCDLDPTLAKPELVLIATFQQTTSGAHQVWSSIRLTGIRSGTLWTASGALMTALRCQVENTSANAAAIAVTNSVTTARWLYCWFSTQTTGTTTGVVSTGSEGLFIGCVAAFGGIAGFNLTNGGTCHSCIALNNTGAGFRSTSATSRVVLLNCTVYNSTSDGIQFTATLTGGFQAVIGCALWVCGTSGTGYGINNSSGTNTNFVTRSCNSFYSCTTGDENGFGDAVNWFSRDEIAQPYTSATDMTPVSTALAIANGFAPGAFELQTFRSYIDIGAVQPIQSTSGVAGIIGDGASW